METIILSLEKSGRKGKAVTLLKGFTRDASALEKLAGEIKRSCGTGGTVKGGVIEIQGDFRERLREMLPKVGFKVKG